MPPAAFENPDTPPIQGDGFPIEIDAETAKYARVLTHDEIKAEELFKKLYRPHRYSKHLKYLEIPEFDAKESFVTDQCYEISETDLDDEDGIKLGLALKVYKPEALIQMYFYRNKMGDAGFHGIIDQLHHVPQMEVLYGAENKFTDDAFKSFLNLVETGGGGKINHISMQKNQIGCQGVKYLAEAISKGVFPNLEWLFLAENQIGDEGVTALAQALEDGACPKMTRLALQGNKFGDPALFSLAKMVSKGIMREEGEYIYVQENEFTQAGREALRTAMVGSDLQGHFGWPPPLAQAELKAKKKNDKRRAAGKMEGGIHIGGNTSGYAVDEE